MSKVAAVTRAYETINAADGEIRAQFPSSAEAAPVPSAADVREAYLTLAAAQREIARLMSSIVEPSYWTAEQRAIAAALVHQGTVSERIETAQRYEREARVLGEV